MKENDKNMVGAMVLAILLISLMLAPWICYQNRVAKKILEDTYKQNIRMEKMVNSNSTKLDSILNHVKAD